MASIDEEILLDAEEDARAAEYILAHLPAEIRERANEETIYYYLDLIAEYYAESGILDGEADADGFVDIDLEQVAEAILKKAKKEKFADFNLEETLLIVESYFDYEESREA